MSVDLSAWSETIVSQTQRAMIAALYWRAGELHCYAIDAAAAGSAFVRDMLIEHETALLAAAHDLAVSL